MNSRHALLPVSVALAIALATIACGSSGTTATTAPAQPPAGEATSEVVEPAVSSPPAEEPSPAGAVMLYATAAVDPSPPGMFYSPQPGTHLVSVELVIDNQSAQPVSVNPLYVTLVDDQGLVHAAGLAASDEYHQLDALDLYPGERIRGWVSFPVEDGSSPSRVKYELGMFSGEYLEASIGASAAEPQWQPVAPSLQAQHLGEVDTVSGYSLSALEIADPAPASGFFTPTEGHHLVSIKVLLRNESATDPLSVNPLYCVLVDDYGFVHSAELGATDLAQIDTLDLAAGEAAQGYVSFQVPDGRSPLYVRYSTDFWGLGEPLMAGLSE